MKLLLLLLPLSPFIRSATINDTRTLLDTLLRNYDTNIRPVENQSLPVNLYVQLSVKSIQEFDEVKGMFAFVGALYLIWNDATMRWNPDHYGGIEFVRVFYGTIWTPQMVLTSPSDEIEGLGKSWNRIRVFSNGTATWFPADLIKSTCSVNVQNFPFDKQNCVTSFVPLGFTTEELTLTPMSSTVDMSIYQPNGLWDVTETTVSTEHIKSGFQIDFTFRIKRKSYFVVLNVILPGIFLNLINCLAFLLQPASGERASYCITVLLAIAVFMTIVNDTLPKTSEPLAIISYKLMVDIISSSLIVFVSLVIIRLFNRDDDDSVPVWLQCIYRAVSGRWYRRGKVKFEDDEINGFVSSNSENGGTIMTSQRKELFQDRSTRIKQVNTTEKFSTRTLKSVAAKVIRRNKVTWKKICYMVDWICLIFFLVVSVVNTLVFLALTSFWDE